MEMAVAMRAKGGSNFLLQRSATLLNTCICTAVVSAQQCSLVLDTFMLMCYSWGIGAKVANDSMRSAATTLAEYANKGGVGDRDG